MEHTGITPSGAVVAPDLAELESRPGPFASVYLVTEAGIDNAAQRAEQRWKTLRGDLDEAGAPVALLEQIDDYVATAHLDGDGLGVVATPGAAPHIEHAPETPAADHARWAPLPAVVPILNWRQSSPPCLVVLADRQGADLVLFHGDGLELVGQSEGSDHPLTKSAPGGWSQRRFQQRAENTWEDNATDVAAEVQGLVDRFDPRVIAVAGDPRAVELLQRALAPPLADQLQVIDGGRAEDGSDRHVAAAVGQLVREAVDRDTGHLLGKFREELGQSDRAADGPEATLASLARGQVEVLLVEERPDDSRLAFFGEDPTQVGLAPGSVAAFGASEPREAGLIDVAVRAALGTGAGIRVVPAESGVSGGLGAILRWPS